MFREIQTSVLVWGNLLCVSGGALKPEKCYWYSVNYKCDQFGVWDYAEIVNAELVVPLSDRTMSLIKRLHANKPNEMLGTLSCPSGGDTAHISVKILGRVETWANRMRNAHLPARLA